MLKFNLYFLIVLALILIPIKSFSQEVEIVPYLKQIEKGELKEAKEGLFELMKEHPFDPSVMFLDAVLTQDAQKALQIYNKILNKYPGSKYADAALYRIYAYYYALGYYDTANTYVERLKADYPGSPYLKIMNRSINYSSQPEQNLDENDSAVDNSTPKNDEQDVSSNEKIFKFTIQAGAFSSKDNALSLQKDLVDAGYYSIIKEKNVAGSTFQVVYVGKFTNEEDAQNLLQVIETKFQINGRVVEIE